jgi:RHS repeat-associated protein
MSGRVAGYRYDASDRFNSSPGYVYDAAARVSSQRSVLSESISTGKERDTESGNDYFGARYYASSMGRWMSPDWGPFPMPVPFALRENPQSLNLYNYVLNNPLTSVDRNGHYHCDPDSSKTTMNGEGHFVLTVTQGACYFDPGDFPNATVARAQNWFNLHLNPVYHIMSIPVKFSIHTERLKDDMTLYNTAINAMLAMISNPGQMDEKQFMQSAVTAINAEKDYQNTAVFGIGADLTELTGLIESHFPGTGTAVENAIKSGMDISEDSLSKTIQTAQGIKTE